MLYTLYALHGSLSLVFPNRSCQFLISDLYETLAMTVDPESTTPVRSLRNDE